MYSNPQELVAPIYMNYTIVKPKNFDKLITYTHNINSIEKYVLVVQINQKYQMIYLEKWFIGVQIILFMLLLICLEMNQFVG